MLVSQIVEMKGLSKDIIKSFKNEGKYLVMELQEKIKEGKEIEELKKDIDEQINNLSKSVTKGDFRELLLRHEELIVKMGKIEYFKNLAKSASSIALGYANIASKSSYASELALIHLLLSRLYADIAYALIKDLNLDPVIPDIMEVSILFTDFPLAIYDPQKLDEIQKKISNMNIDEAVKKELVDDLNKLVNAFKVKIEEFDDGMMIFIGNGEELSDFEDHDAIVKVYRTRNRKIDTIDIIYTDKDD